MPLFTDRMDAGRRLAERLAKYEHNRTLVLALPRGGVPVGYEIARALHSPLDTIIVRKVGTPFNPEFAVGAVAPHGILFLDDEAISTSGASPMSIQGVLGSERRELERRAEAYRSGSFSFGFAPNTLILVDDGIATGMSMKAAAAAARKKYAKVRLIVAAPVCFAELTELSEYADEIVCLECPSNMHSVGQAYEQFPQLEDEEVMVLLTRAAHEYDALKK